MGDSKIYLSEAKEEDIKDIMNVENESFPVGIRERTEVFSERIKTFPQGFLLLKENDKTIGYISSEIWQLKDEVFEDQFCLGHSICEVHNFDGEELYVSSMGTLKGVRKRGFGHQMFKNLLDGMLEKYPNIKSCVLIVSTEWTAARKIYKHNGFKELFTIKDFFTPSDIPFSDGIVMRKRLR